MRNKKILIHYMKSQVGRIIMIFIILTAGTYHHTRLVPAANQGNKDLLSQISGVSDQPFGELSTPLDGSVVRGSIPVTGWALDNNGVDSVKIYMESCGMLFYLGDAVMVEGARPDVEAAYPDYPDNSSAGWGYMLLTNLLPDNGNGYITIHARVSDIDGNEVELGKKTILCDNDNSLNISENKSLPYTRKPLATHKKTVELESYETLTHVLSRDPVIAKIGSHPVDAKLLYPNEQGIIFVEIKEPQRLELRFFPGDGSRELIARDGLPLGSVLDGKAGICVIVPSPGYVGTYPIVFDIREPDGSLCRQEILVNILPVSSVVVPLPWPDRS